MTFFGAVLMTLAPLTVATAADLLVYVGTYTKGASKGIYGYRFQTATGRLKPLGVKFEMSSPSFLALHPNGRFLYAVAEDAGTADAFAIGAKSGKLDFLNQVSSHGKGPCHLALDATGRWLAVANYESGHMALFPVQPDGKLGEAVAVEQHTGSSVNQERQKGPHAH
ncbi:MAG TPA: beta-propeller fold lactonase family protein, partial [Bryobacteraceae bacterium]